MPVVPICEQELHPGGSRAGVPGPQNHQQPLPLMQQQMLGENLYSLAELLEAESATKVNGMLSKMDPTEVLHLLHSPEALKAKVAEAMWVLRNAMPSRVAGLTSALAIASPTERRIILGENLYPLVEQLEAESAAKVTGMLLEMDTRDVIHLLESPEALKAKVSEAMEVLRIQECDAFARCWCNLCICKCFANQGKDCKPYSS
ncbi:putative polyadenylate-binding protein/Hyperplastic disc protein [Helianthus annuus]|nr:putative polyadenylate-binding protein/Hyperplastic disc protein [Helianthus annuus]